VHFHRVRDSRITYPRHNRVSMSLTYCNTKCFFQVRPPGLADEFVAIALKQQNGRNAVTPVRVQTDRRADGRTDDAAEFDNGCVLDVPFSPRQA